MIYEEIYHMCQGRRTPISMTHIYGHNWLVYNEEADALAKAGAALSKVHKLRRVRDIPQERGEASRRKQTRVRGIKRQAAVQALDESTDSDKPAHIRDRRREMRNVPLDIPDLSRIEL